MMTAQALPTAAPELVETQRGCKVYDSSWRPGVATENLAVGVSGQKLKLELVRWKQGQSLDVPADAGEEMGAVLEGRFELRCGDEVHVLTPGLGLLIPAGHEHRWTALEPGVLYRVRGPSAAA